ncbi:MAG: ribbon-helix-helix domain-containing protein [Bdellovibrionales bacterium]
MKIVKRSIRIARHNTSLTLETEFWDELKRIAKSRKFSLNQLVAKIDRERSGNLSSALRLYVLNDLKSALRRSE